MSNSKNKEKKHYKYLSWGKDTIIDLYILPQLEELYKEGWIVISHSQNQYGMSVILANTNL